MEVFISSKQKNIWKENEDELPGISQGYAPMKIELLEAMVASWPTILM